MTNPFVFIVGCARSGTTLFRRMVDAHPMIAIIPEIGWLARKYQRREGLTPEGQVTPEFVATLGDKGGFGRYTPLPISREELTERIASGPPLGYAGLISLLFDRYGEDRGKRLVGNKTVDHALNVGTLHQVFPETKFVHLIRDGRDVASSLIAWRRSRRLAQKFSTWNEDPMTTAALWWEWHVRRAREAGLPLGSDLYHEVRYEPLVVRPVEECGALCEFLGVPFDDRMVRFHEGKEKDDPNLDAKEAWRPPTPGLRDWRNDMSSKEVEKFEAVAGGLLEELGYPRGADGVSEERLEHADRLRERFEGRPLPRRWRTVGAARR